MRKVVVLAIALALSVTAAPAKKKAPASVAPDAVPHQIALFLGSLCNEGSRPVTFKARALGVRFFFEEPTGVTVYRFEKGRYVREKVLRGFTLERAVKRYAKK
jgi:hypothetical protein